MSLLDIIVSVLAGLALATIFILTLRENDKKLEHAHKIAKLHYDNSVFWQNIAESNKSLFEGYRDMWKEECARTDEMREKVRQLREIKF